MSTRITPRYYQTISTEPTCVADLASSITVNRPTDTPNTGWGNNLLNSSTMSGDLEFKFTIDSTTGNTPQMIGLDNNPTAGSSYTDIDYAIYLYENGATKLLRVYENGAYRGNFTPVWNVGDELSVVRTGTLIEYKLNGTTFYTSTIASTVDIGVDSSFYYAAGTRGSGSISLSNISLCNS